jgi:hypothetical protein
MIDLSTYLTAISILSAIIIAFVIYNLRSNKKNYEINQNNSKLEKDKFELEKKYLDLQKDYSDFQANHNIEIEKLMKKIPKDQKIGMSIVHFPDPELDKIKGRSLSIDEFNF